MPLDKSLIKILACPECKTGVTHQHSKTKETLTCTTCKRIFPVINGIPHMLPKGPTF
jgi:uncharacterized protein YbaR (Trm112 family)